MITDAARAPFVPPDTDNHQLNISSLIDPPVKRNTKLGHSGIDGLPDGNAPTDAITELLGDDTGNAPLGFNVLLNIFKNNTKEREVSRRQWQQAQDLASKLIVSTVYGAAGYLPFPDEERGDLEKPIQGLLIDNTKG